MKLIAVALASACCVSTAAAAAEWYAVRKGNEGCTTSLTPGAMLRLADATGARATSFERKDAAGNVASVSVTMDQGGSTITAEFFSSEAACLASIPGPRSIPESYD